MSMTQDELSAIVEATKVEWFSPGATRESTKQKIAKDHLVPKELVEIILRTTTEHKALKLF